MSNDSEYKQTLQRIDTKINDLLVEHQQQKRKVLLAGSLKGGMSSMMAAIVTVGIGYIRLLGQGKV